MALLLKTIYKGYSWLFEEMADPRVEELNLFLMSSPLKPALVIGFYLYFIYNIGPKFMKDRKPFNLKKILIVYNIAQIILNSYIVYESAIEVFFNISWDCAPIEYIRTPRALDVLRVYHAFFLIKMLDLLDTIFFVLRKKYNQISFLHVYHHFGMCLLIWIAVKYLGGGSGVFVGFLNGTVHVIMYIYYLLSVIDEKWKKSVTFKKSLTQIQMLQFLLFIIIYGRLLFKPDCTYPKICSFFFVPQNCFMLILFGDFYRKTYLSKKKERKEVTENGKNLIQ